MFNKIITRCRWLLAFFIFFMSTVPLDAKCSWEDSYFKAWFVPERAKIRIDLRYYQTWGALGQGRQGFVPAKGGGGANIHVLGYDVQVYCNEDGNGYMCNAQKDGQYVDVRDPKYTNLRPDNVTVEWYRTEGDEYYSWCSIEVPVRNNYQGNQDVHLTGPWWTEGGVGDDDRHCDDHRSVDCTWYMSPPEMVGEPTYVDGDSNGGVPGYEVKWRSDGNQKYDWISRVALFIGDRVVSTTRDGNAIYEGWPDQKSGTLFVPLKSFNVNNFENMSLRSHYDCNLLSVKHQRDFVRKAFPQVRSVNAQLQRDSHSALVQFEVNPTQGSGDYFDNTFILEVVKTPIGTGQAKTETFEIPFKVGTTSYTQEVALPEELQHNVTFKVGAKKAWNWAGWHNPALGFYPSVQQKYELQHYRVTEATSVLNADNLTSTLTWKIAGNHWSPGAEMNIVRYLNGGEDYRYTLSSLAEIQKGTWVDKTMTSCKSYTYGFQITPPTGEPGKTFTAKDEIKLNNKIIPVQIGEVQQLKTSKGFFSDYTEVRWTTLGNFDYFNVNRRENKPDAGEFVYVGKVERGTSSHNSFRFEDRTCTAGTVYEYQVVGVVRCEGVDHSATCPEQSYGFRMPTGDVSGRITFESGQGVQDVTVRLTSDEAVSRGYSLRLDGSEASYLQTDKAIAQSSLAYTMQVHARPEANANGILMQKDSYVLGLENGVPYFKVGDDPQNKVKADDPLATDRFTPLAVIYKDEPVQDKIYLVVYGNEKKVYVADVQQLPQQQNAPLVGGKGFKGHLDEMRVWDRSLDLDELDDNYNRMLVGDEEGLVGYYRFNEPVKNEFYDLSHEGDNFHENHGKINGAVTFVNDVVPSEDILAFAARTDAIGDYRIVNVPYAGKGTMYTVTPFLNIHKFTYNSGTGKVNLTIGPGQTNTGIDFVDVSSFKMSGVVYYAESTVPVGGVNFMVDGQYATNENRELVTTGADGVFSIDVPVGKHEVKAVKPQHKFKDGGKMLNPLGQNIDYQENLSNLIFWDDTKVKLIGKVVGGPVEYDKPTGHSQSVNNLGDEIILKLKLKEKTGRLMDERVLDTLYTHYHAEYSNPVRVDDKCVEIKANPKTGEYVAYVIPEAFTVSSLWVTGYNELIGSVAPTIDLTNKLGLLPKPAVINSTSGEPVDTVYYNEEYSYRMDVTPTYDFVEVNVGVDNGDTIVSPKAYFGNQYERISVIGDDGQTVHHKVELCDRSGNNYYLGMPVYKMKGTYHLLISAFMPFAYNNDPAMGVDRVAVTDGEVNINNGMNGDRLTLPLNAEGKVMYSFLPTDPDVTLATRGVKKLQVGLKANGRDYGSTEKEVYVIGSKSNGSDFVTQGPSKLLMVLRDPPGSNSYSYTSDNITLSYSTSYIANGFSQEGEGAWGLCTGAQLKQVVGGPALGVIQTGLDMDNQFQFLASHSVEGQEDISESHEMTISTSFQTSDDPDYVGRDADVLIGNSTNMVIGQRTDLGIMPSANVKPEDMVKDLGNGFCLCRNISIAAEEQFATLFAYPQIHIENVLIPKYNLLIEQLLGKGQGLTPETARAMAERDNEAIYVPKVDPEGSDYGKPNPGGAKLNRDAGVCTGTYYDIYFPMKVMSSNEQLSDSLLNLVIARDNWVALLEENERKKVAAFTSQGENISFQAGASLERSITYVQTQDSAKTVTFQVGSGVASDIQTRVALVGSTVSFQETASGHGGNEEAISHAKENTIGFVLADEGTDYMSIDVYSPGKMDVHTGDIAQSDTSQIIAGDSYIFRLRGGATSGPHEDVQFTQYYEPGQHKLNEGSLQIEKPRIEVYPASVANVPANKPAVFTLNLFNESEVQEDGIYDLRLVDNTLSQGAKLSIDGVALGDGRAFLVPYGDILKKKLEVRRGAEDFDYENMQIVLVSQSQGDPTANFPVIADTITLSAHFVPASTEVKIKSPGNGWTLNLDNERNEEGKPFLPIWVDGFDVNDPNFDRIEVQYKPVSESKLWTTLRTFYKDEKRPLTKPEVEEHIGKQTTLQANFVGEQDQRYDIRAVSFTKYGNEFVTYTSETLNGIKDTQRPQIFGMPSPADGILNVGDDICLTFNEDIANGYLSIDNFEITAIKNGAPNDRSVALSMDGINDGFASAFGKDWSNRDLTVEGWVNFAALDGEQTIFALGERNNGCSLKYANGQLIFSASGQMAPFSLTCTPANLKANEWCHLGAVIDFEQRQVRLYHNYEMVGEAGIQCEYKIDGKFFLAHDGGNGKRFKGMVDDFRIWDKTMAAEDLQYAAQRKLMGAEPSLVAYYPMDEARGDVLLDKARGNNAQFVGDWKTPDGYAMSFDGVDDIMIITSKVNVDRDQDYTLEFWFKANAQITGNATLLCNGKSDLTDATGETGTMLVGFENGELVVRSEGNVEKVKGSYDDQQWHHFLLTVNRISGYAQVYMDGQLVHYFDSDRMGQISGPYLYAGARRYAVTSDASQESTDQFFNGSIDELRVWNNSFTQSTIEHNGNAKMTGKEMGLITYYPFEEWVTNTSNVSALVPSNKEQTQKEQTTVEEGGAKASQNDHAPVVEAGKKDFVNYNFVGNKEALILTLTEPEDRIENTVLNIAVRRVRDVNGNEMDGVVRWSAFVDRNALRWADTKKVVNIQQGEGAAFTMALNNTAGVAKHFVLEGMPAWMEVTPMSGKIEPAGTMDIQFRVSEGTNVGRYDERIYARGDNNVAEALPVQVKVNGQLPDWKVDAGRYDHNMSIFAQLRFDGALSQDEEDRVGVFKQGECVGVSTSTYDKVRDMWYTYITVYTNEMPAMGADLKADYEFRLWDASTGQLYAGTVDQLVFNNGICGSVADLVQIAGTEMKFRNLDLGAGWNWVTFAVLPAEGANSNTVLKNGRWQDGDIVKQLSAFDSYSEKEGQWVGTLGNTYVRTNMYMLKSAQPQLLSIQGAESQGLSLKVTGQKWNYIGYTPAFNMTVQEALAGYAAVEGDVIKSQTAFAMYSDGGWVGNLKHMEANRGYMLFRNVAGDVTFAYPAIRGAYSQRMSRSAVAEVYNEAASRYASNMTLIARPVFADLQEGDRIEALVGGELRGQSQLVQCGEETLHYLTVPGNEEDRDVIFTLVRGDEVVATSSTVVPFVSNAAHGQVTKAMEISFDEGESQVSVYPNPFVNYLNIQFFAEAEGKAEISIYDLAGRRVMYKMLDAHAGINKYTWNASAQGGPCSGGVHLVRVTVDGKTAVHEVIKK